MTNNAGVYLSVRLSACLCVGETDGAKCAFSLCVRYAKTVDEND